MKNLTSGTTRLIDFLPYLFGLLQEIDDSVDRIVAGMEGTPMVDGKSKSLVAYHEVCTSPCDVQNLDHVDQW